MCVQCRHNYEGSAVLVVLTVPHTESTPYWSRQLWISSSVPELGQLSILLAQAVDKFTLPVRIDSVHTAWTSCLNTYIHVPSYLPMTFNLWLHVLARTLELYRYNPIPTSAPYFVYCGLERNLLLEPRSKTKL